LRKGSLIAIIILCFVEIFLQVVFVDRELWVKELCSEGQEKYLRELSITPVGYFTGAIKNHSRVVSHRNYFAWQKWGISEEQEWFFGRWRDRARFLTFTVIALTTDGDTSVTKGGKKFPKIFKIVETYGHDLLRSIFWWYCIFWICLSVI
jgi:hypothetical protein